MKDRYSNNVDVDDVVVYAVRWGNIAKLQEYTVLEVADNSCKAMSTDKFAINPSVLKNSKNLAIIKKGNK